MTALGYIRKSVEHEGVPTLTYETQEQAIRALAARHGDHEITLITDKNVSGKKERNNRHGWNEVLRAIESGEATAVYAYSLSRFARSVQQLKEFADLCAQKGVKFRCERDAIDTSSATGVLFFHLLAAIAQFESDVTSERIKDAFAAKRVRDPSWTGPGNEKYGALPGEDAQAVLDAFRATKSFDGAARLLHAQGVHCRGKRNVWHGTTVADIVRRLAPDEVGPATGRGIKAGTHRFRLSRLLVCSQCQTVMTPSLDYRQNLVRYYCREARTTPHARGWVTEPRLMPTIQAEADRALPLIRKMQKGSQQDEALLAALHAKRGRIVDTYTDGVIDKAERDRRLAVVTEQESKLSVRRAIKRITIPPDFEHADPGKVNAYLRRVFEKITVDMSQPTKRGPQKGVLPLAFKWVDEALRGDLVA